MLFTADFETTTDVSDCRVWAYGICEIGNEDNFFYGNNMDDFFRFCSGKENHTLYFHNLKFDAEFIMCELFKRGFTHVLDSKDLVAGTFSTLISDKGIFYSMEIMFDKTKRASNKVTIYDSLKLLNFSVAEIAKGFNLPISKLEIDYDEFREVGHKLTEHEVDYLRNDVTIVAKALSVLFMQGMTKMTTGSNALANYKETLAPKVFERRFPIPVYDKDIRQSYRGGFTYCDPRHKGQDVGEGIVLDVNSLYPSVMYYQPLPFGEGKFFQGQYVQDDRSYTLYIQMLTCQFDLKPDHIPTIHLKNTLQFIPTEYVTTSGDEEVTMCLTSVDLALFFAHYDVFNITYHSGWKFMASTGLFREYIDKWNAVKVESTINGNKAMRTIAKLMLNSLYGKFALNPKVRNKNPYYDHGMIRYTDGAEEMRDPIYIPVGTFITSWARYKTITSAQLVYDRFLYADTDSLHLLGTEIPPMLEIHDSELGKWKHEATFTRARFVRQKTYIEEIGGKMHITCAGMPSKCYEGVTWENFCAGSKFKGKLQPTHVSGGIVLKTVDFTIKR